MNFKAAIFDLDGTLLNSIADIGNSMNKVLAGHGYPIHPLEKYNSYVGNGLRVMVERAISIEPQSPGYDAIVTQCLSEMIEDYEQNCTLLTRPYEGIIDLLDILYEKSCIVSVLSNKAQHLTEKMVDALINKEKRYVTHIIGERAGYPNKPDPAGVNEIVKLCGLPKSDFIYIGDTGTDMLTAKNANIYSFGVTWGFRERRELIENGACRLIDRPIELLSEIVQ